MRFNISTSTYRGQVLPDPESPGRVRAELARILRRAWPGPNGPKNPVSLTPAGVGNCHHPCRAQTACTLGVTPTSSLGTFDPGWSKGGNDMTPINVPGITLTCGHSSIRAYDALHNAQLNDWLAALSRPCKRDRSPTHPPRYTVQLTAALNPGASCLRSSFETVPEL